MSGATGDAFTAAERERAADRFGVWTFLVSEAMLFGALLLAYAVSRRHFGEAFVEGSHHLNLWLGTLNTAVLLTSSFTMVLADGFAEAGRRRHCLRALLATAGLGLAFLAVKAVEYALEIREGLLPMFRPETGALETRDTDLFFDLYLAMTGLHALHLATGILLVLWTALSTRGAAASGWLGTRCAGTALYWHFVDIVWVFLFPLLYLVV